MSLLNRAAAARVGQAGREFAAVWAIYAIVETALLTIRPWWLRDVLAVYLPWSVSSDKVPGISVVFAAVVLAACPLAGAAIGLVISIGIANSARGRLAVTSAHSATLWSSLGGLALVVVFAFNALLRNRIDVVPAVTVPLALTSLRLMSAWRPAWRAATTGLTGPWLISTLLVGGAYTIQMRAHLSVLTRGFIALAFLSSVLVVALLLRRVVTRVAWRFSGSDAARTASAWTILLAAACVLLSSAMARLEPATPRWPVGVPGAGIGRPNVILITLDTVRADHLSVYGYGRDTTPNLRQWAREGFTVYRAASAASNHTLPTHASIFTGWNSHRHGAQVSLGFPAGRPIAAEAPVLPVLLAGHGYLTAGIAANAIYVRSELGFGRGFAYYDSDLPAQTFSPTPPYFLAETLRELVATAFRTVDAEPSFWTAAEVNRKAAGLLDHAIGTGQPFFLFLNYMDAHVPYVPPPPFDTRYQGADPSFRWFTYNKLREDVAIRRTRVLDGRAREHLTSQYDGAIAYLDQQLGALLARLRESGVYDNSLIIVTADHGEGLGERSLIGHGLSLYQHELHVPLMVKYPHATTGTVVETPVGSVDVLPTILDVVGVTAPSDLDGVSLRRVERIARRAIVAESSDVREADGHAALVQPAEIALISGAMKLISHADGRTELYELSKDPLEQTDLSRSTQVPESWRLIIARLAAQPARSSQGLPVDPSVLERLRSLGYVR